jgi:uncharacterized membrane protein YvbJ
MVDNDTSATVANSLQPNVTQLIDNNQQSPIFQSTPQPSQQQVAGNPTTTQSSPPMRPCTKCGYLNEQDLHFCNKCGFALTNIQSQPQQVYNIANNSPYDDGDPSKGRGLSIAALVMGILSIICSGLAVFTILAIIFGIITLKNASKSYKGMGIAGLALGIISIPFMIMAWVNFQKTYNDIMDQLQNPDNQSQITTLLTNTVNWISIRLV